MDIPALFQATVRAKLFGRKQTGKVYSDGENLYFFPYSLEYSQWQLAGLTLAALIVGAGLYWSGGLEVGSGMQLLRVQAIQVGLGFIGYPMLAALLVAMGLNVRGHLKQRAAMKLMGEEETYLGADLSERAQLDPSCVVVPLAGSELRTDAKGLSLVTSDGDRIRMEPLERDLEFAAKLAQVKQITH